MKYCKVGDLVKKKKGKGVYRKMRGELGVVVEVEQTKKPGPSGQLIRVKWQGDYGTFYDSRENLCLISEG